MKFRFRKIYSIFLLYYNLVYIAVRPTVAINSRFPNLRQGKRKSIKCKGSGYPVPEISWFRGSREITGNITKNDRNVTADLILTRVSDTNLYMYVTNKNKILEVV